MLIKNRLPNIGKVINNFHNGYAKFKIIINAIAMEVMNFKIFRIFLELKNLMEIILCNNRKNTDADVTGTKTNDIIPKINIAGTSYPGPSKNI